MIFIALKTVFGVFRVISMWRLFNIRFTGKLPNPMTEEQMQNFNEFVRYSPEYFHEKMEVWSKTTDDFIYYDIIGFFHRVYLVIRNPLFLLKVEFDSKLALNPAEKYLVITEETARLRKLGKERIIRFLTMLKNAFIWLLNILRRAVVNCLVYTSLPSIRKMYNIEIAKREFGMSEKLFLALKTNIGSNLKIVACLPDFLIKIFDKEAHDY